LPKPLHLSYTHVKKHNVGIDWGLWTLPFPFLSYQQCIISTYTCQAILTLFEISCLVTAKNAHIYDKIKGGKKNDNNKITNNLSQNFAHAQASKTIFSEPHT